MDNVLFKVLGIDENVPLSELKVKFVPDTNVSILEYSTKEKNSKLFQSVFKYIDKELIAVAPMAFHEQCKLLSHPQPKISFDKLPNEAVTEYSSKYINNVIMFNDEESAKLKNMRSYVKKIFEYAKNDIDHELSSNLIYRKRNFIINSSTREFFLKNSDLINYFRRFTKMLFFHVYYKKDGDIDDDKKESSLPFQKLVNEFRKINRSTKRSNYKKRKKLYMQEIERLPPDDRSMILAYIHHSADNDIEIITSALSLSRTGYRVIFITEDNDFLPLRRELMNIPDTNIEIYTLEELDEMIRNYSAQMNLK